MSRAEYSTNGPQNPRTRDEDPNQQNFTPIAPKRRNLSLANISIPTILKRKPLPVNSPVAAQKRSQSVDSLRLNPPPRQPPSNLLTPIPSPGSTQFVLRDLDSNPHGNTPRPEVTPTSLYSGQGTGALAGEFKNPAPRSRPHSRNVSLPVVNNTQPRHDRNFSLHSAKQFLFGASEEDHNDHPIGPKRASTMTAVASHGPGLRLHIDRATVEQDDDLDSLGMPKTPRSPVRKLSNFFGWKKQQSAGADSPSTTFSDRSFSQPVSPMPPLTHGHHMQKPAALDIPRANAAAQTSYFPVTPGLPTPPISSTHMAQVERELREISSELANSIKREMELEEEIDRLQAETHPQGLEAGRRTSDYYSDSGAGSVRFPTGDGEGKIEQLERLRRAAEQEKALLKVEMSERLQDALQQKREAEERSQSLHERLQAQGGSIVDSDRVRELEASLEDTRRRLAEERQFRQNFQDLVGGMRLEIEQHKNEKENLRDEVLPQLRAKIEGLESEAAEAQSMVYENTRIQQELHALKDENQTLKSARRMQLDMLQQGSRIGVISENVPPVPPSPQLGAGLKRSKSFAARGGRTSRSNSNAGERTLSRADSVRAGPGLARADSVRAASGALATGAAGESREALTQKVKDIEEQRNALHKTLRLLLDRYMIQEKTHAKRVRKLEKERDSVLSLTPRRTAFHTEVKILKDEVVTLRRRADDALDSKWQYEKNLGSLKMDLDSAQQETSSLRALLQQRDLFVSERPGSRNGPTSEMTSTMLLDKAYEELRTTHALSIAHLKDMEAGDLLTGANGEADNILELLKQSISEAEAERDRVQSQAEEYRRQARTLQKSELDHLNKEQSLASDLYASAQRMDDLANQVQSQLQSNSALRQRLAEAIERGEREQKSSTVKIAQMQGKLRELEEKLMAAQQHSEEMVNTHEDEVRQMQDPTGLQLQRGNPALLSGLSSPVSAVFALKSPRLDRTTSGVGLSIAEATKTTALERRVGELEKALSEADKEMGEVVSRMNKAQMEVAELQSERDDAMMKTRRLQAEVVQERATARQLMS